MLLPCIVSFLLNPIFHLQQLHEAPLLAPLPRALAPSIPRAFGQTEKFRSVNVDGRDAVESTLGIGVDMARRAAGVQAGE